MTFQLLRLYATARSGGLSFPATLDDWTQMAVSLPDAIPRGSLLQLSPWMFKTLSERSGQLVLVVPIQLGTYYEQVFGAKFWVRCNLTHEEFAQLDDCSRGGGALSNNPGHYQCSLSQVTMRLCRGLDGDEGVAMRSIVPFLFHSYFYPGNSGSRGWVGYCRDVLFGYSARRLLEPVGYVPRRDGFDQEFRRLSPDGHLFRPWGDQGGSLCQHVEYIAGLGCDGFSELYSAWQRFGPTYEQSLEQLGTATLYVPVCGRAYPTIGRVCSGGGTEFQDRDGSPTIYVSGPCTRDEGAGDGLQSPSAGEHAVSPRCGDGSGRADGEDCKEEQREEPAVGLTTLGHDEPGQPPAAGSNEVPVPKLQSAPIKLPGAPHPPPQLPDGVFPIGGIEVIKRSKNKRIRRKRAQESAARDADGGPSQDLYTDS